MRDPHAPCVHDETTAVRRVGRKEARPDRVEAGRAAVAETKRRRILVDPVSAEKIQTVIQRSMSTPERIMKSAAGANANTPLSFPEM